MNKKVLIGIVVALIVLMIALIWFTDAESKLKYSLNADGVSYSVIGIGFSFDSNLVIPSEYKGLPVTRIGDYAFNGNGDKIKSVVIPDSVKIIGEHAFEALDLTELILSNSLTHIGEMAFAGQVGLESIRIPNSVKIIGDGAFFFSWSLSKIYFDGTVKEWHLIRLGSAWNAEVPATKVICSDGTVTLK